MKIETSALIRYFKDTESTIKRLQINKKVNLRTTPLKTVKRTGRLTIEDTGAFYSTSCSHDYFKT